MPDQSTGSTHDEGHSIWDTPITRRQLITEGPIRVAGGLLALNAAIATALSACGIGISRSLETPKDETQGLIDSTIRAYNALLAQPLVSSSTEETTVATILTAVLLHQGGVGDALQCYRDFHSLKSSDFGNAQQPGDGQMATLGAIAQLSKKPSIHGINGQLSILDEYKTAYQDLNAFSSEGFSDQTNLAINLVALRQIPGMREEQIKSILIQIGSFKKITGETEKDVIGSATGAIIMALFLQERMTGDYSTQHVLNIADHMNNILVGPTNSQLAILTLASEFSQNVGIVENIYNRFTGDPFAYSSNDSAALALASVLSGKDNSRQIQHMFEYARHYQGLDDDTATQLTLITAMSHGKLPPLLQDAEAIATSFFPFWYYLIIMNNSDEYTGGSDSIDTGGDSGGSDGGDGGDSGGGAGGDGLRTHKNRNI